MYSLSSPFYSLCTHRHTQSQWSDCMYVNIYKSTMCLIDSDIRSAPPGSSTLLHRQLAQCGHRRPPNVTFCPFYRHYLWPKGLSTFKTDSVFYACCVLMSSNYRVVLKRMHIDFGHSFLAEITTFTAWLQ